jgi:response regulator RpfG family c-di-GMP phosphodiesterase
MPVVGRESGVCNQQQPRIRLHDPEQHFQGHVADEEATASESANLVRKNRQLAEERDKLKERVLEAFTSALEARDPATRSHCERVAKLASRLAKQLDLAPQKVADLVIACGCTISA